MTDNPLSAALTTRLSKLDLSPTPTDDVALFLQDHPEHADVLPPLLDRRRTAWLRAVHAPTLGERFRAGLVAFLYGIRFRSALHRIRRSAAYDTTEQEEQALNALSGWHIARDVRAATLRRNARRDKSPAQTNVHHEGTSRPSEALREERGQMSGSEQQT